jgi:hypothetical protein
MNRVHYTNGRFLSSIDLPGSNIFVPLFIPASAQPSDTRVVECVTPYARRAFAAEWLRVTGQPLEG